MNIKYIINYHFKYQTKGNVDCLYIDILYDVIKNLNGSTCLICRENCAGWSIFYGEINLMAFYANTKLFILKLLWPLPLRFASKIIGCWISNRVHQFDREKCQFECKRMLINSAREYSPFNWDVVTKRICWHSRRQILPAYKIHRFDVISVYPSGKTFRLWNVVHRQW